MKSKFLALTLILVAGSAQANGVDVHTGLNDMTRLQKMVSEQNLCIESVANAECEETLQNNCSLFGGMIMGNTTSVNVYYSCNTVVTVKVQGRSYPHYVNSLVVDRQNCSLIGNNSRTVSDDLKQGVQDRASSNLLSMQNFAQGHSCQ